MKIEYTLRSKEATRGTEGVEGTELLYLIEGNLQIHRGTECFFDDPYMNLLEFAVCLHKWLCISGAINDFIFESIDHDEPILVFRRINKEKWVVDSIWRRGEELLVTGHELISALAEFLARFDRYLHDEYRLSIKSLSQRAP